MTDNRVIGTMPITARTTSVLVTGGEDFKGIVGEAKRLGRKIEIAAFGSSASRDFQQCGNHFIPLDDIVDKIRVE